MASSPVKLFSVLLLASAVGWLLFVFASRMLAWLLSRILGASIGFRVSGCNSLRDVTIKFKKGAVESLSIGEIKLSLRESLVKLGFSFISRNPKLQLLICDFEVVLQSSVKSNKKEKSRRSRSGGRGRWMILTSIARFLSISVIELTVKVPKAVIEVRDLMIDISKNGGSNPILNIKLQIVPLLIYIDDSRLGFDQSSCDQPQCPLVEQTCSSLLGKASAPFVCEDLLIVCELNHDREAGVKFRNFDASSGVVFISLNEELLQKAGKKSERFIESNAGGGASIDINAASPKKKLSAAELRKQMLIFPEQVSFNMPKLEVKFFYQSCELVVANNIKGIHLSCSKSQSFEDSGEAASHYDFQLDFNEIHIVRENAMSVLEIMKVVLTASLDVPVEPSLPLRVEMDVKLGGTQCNVILNRLKPWLCLQMSKKKSMNLRKDNYRKETVHMSDVTAVLWTCTVSAPEMTIVLYSLNGLPLYHGCSQSSHFFANNIASECIQVHGELGELYLHMEDDCQEYLKEHLFAVETNSGSLVHVAHVSIDRGQKEIDLEGGKECKWNSEFNIDISGMGVNFGFKHLETLISTMVSFKAFFKSLSPGKKTIEKKDSRSSKKELKGAKLTKLNLEKCSINFFGDVDIEDIVVEDPKRVNFGSQGGVVIINKLVDGTPRRANIFSNLPNGCKKLHFSISLDMSLLKLCIDKEKDLTRVDIERVSSIYQEYVDEQNPATKITLFGLQNAKFVRRFGGLNEVSVCSLFSATDIMIRWEPDIHLAFHEIVTRIKYMIANKKLHDLDYETRGKSPSLESAELEKATLVEHVPPEKQYRKRESVFAIDVERLHLSAEVGDGVEAVVYVKSIFSENAKIGILLEGLLLSINNARVLRSNRMQISRIPVSSVLHDEKAQTFTIWDWVIQGSDIQICMPYRLQLRAIDDAFEDMLRGLKLISSKGGISFPNKEDSSKKVKNMSPKVGSVRFRIHNLLADIEEEPMQGWLDEHYQLLKSQVCDLSVRLKFLDDMVNGCSGISGSIDSNDVCSKRTFHHNGVEIVSCDPSSINKLREEIQKQAFRSYYEACQKIVLSEGSGTCTGFQGGFKPSISRASLLSLRAENLDVTLTKIEGGNPGMIEFIRKVDPASVDSDIPLSRMYGRDIALQTKSLAVQLRNYTFPLFSATDGKCQGRVVLAQQATCFQPQIQQDVFIGKWRKICMLRSANGTTPAMKAYTDLPIFFHKGEVSFGVGYEPAFADISYAFTVALRRAILSTRSTTSLQTAKSNTSESQSPNKERSLPWWDDLRYYIHGKICLCFSETKWTLLATTNPYEKLDKLQILSGYMNIQQSDGHVRLSAMEFKVYVSSLDSLVKNCSLKPPHSISIPFLDCPSFSLEVTMDWECESGNPLNHYLHALPCEGKHREKVYDPFRSTSLSLRWNFILKPFLQHSNESYLISGEDSFMEDRFQIRYSENLANASADSTAMNLGAHDIAWLFKWWNLYYNPPHKLRSFSRWPRFGIPKAARSGNLSLDKVMTEFFLRLDSTPTCIKHMPLIDDDPATGLTFRMAKLKYEFCYSRGKQRYTFHCRREPLDLVYQGLDLHVLKAYLNRNDASSVRDVHIAKQSTQSAMAGNVCNEKHIYIGSCTERNQDDGFLLFSDYFTIRRQAPKADPARLLAWQEAGRKNLEMTYVRSEFENGSESDQTRSDPSDDDGFNVIIADNCQRIFIYGLKLLWTIENRDAVWSWVHGISQVFELPKPSPSRQYAQRKYFAEQQSVDKSEMQHGDDSMASMPVSHGVSAPSTDPVEASISPRSKLEPSSSGTQVKHEDVECSPEEGTRHFMVNVVQPQFNLHSDEANGRFLLAAASGRVLARSFHSVLSMGYQMIEQALGNGSVHIPDSEPEMTWKQMELSVMLEHVQAHVAPTDVDPGAGLQWLPKILRSSPKVKRTGALLERVFMPCQMYFRYTRHKGGTADLKVKPLKELTFNSPNITATMTSRQFHVMLDVLSNLLFARLPKPRKSSLSYPSEDDDIEEEADEVVPDGVEEVELAKINLEKRERERKLLIDDIRTLSVTNGTSRDLCLSPNSDADLWMITGGKLILVRGLKKDLGKANKYKKAASSALRSALQKAAQLRLMEKEKNKSPSYAMRISLRISKVVWSMLSDGKSFAETEINDMIYDFDRDYKDIGIALFTTKSFVVRNCLPNAKSDMLLSAWNAPPEWGKNVMLRVDAKQGAPKDGSSPLELFQVEIYPLKIHLTEAMYRMMWDYFFPEEEQDSQRRQDFWKVSTTAGSRRPRRNALGYEATGSSSQSTRELTAPGKVDSVVGFTSMDCVNQSSVPGDFNQGSKSQNVKANIICSTSRELRRTSSFDRTWEDNDAENVDDELVFQPHSSGISSKKGPLNSMVDIQHGVNEETSKNKAKDSKLVKSARLSHEEKKLVKSQDEKRDRKMMEFHYIKISQVELLVTYEGSRFAVNDLRLLMDTFHRADFTGTWRRLFSRVKKHIIWGVLKSVTGMQGKKFKDKVQSQREARRSGVLDSDLNLSDSDGGQPGKSDQYPTTWLKRPSDGAGDGFVTSIRGLFNSQRRKAKAFVLRTMRGEADNGFHDDWSESDVEFPPFARQLTITKARKLIKRHTKKLRSKGQKNSGWAMQRESLPSSPRDPATYGSDSSVSSSFEDFCE